LHGGALAKLLKDSVRAAVCRGCHPSPSGAHHQFSTAQLKAAGDESKVEISGCLYCHLPHASAERRLLLAPNHAVCQGCHKN
jgi:predicted CXXCH cytochrome family protein